MTFDIKKRVIQELISVDLKIVILIVSSPDLRCGFRWDLWLTVFEVPIYLAWGGRVGLGNIYLTTIRRVGVLQRPKARVSI
jgi:hypothetical protein